MRSSIVDGPEVFRAIHGVATDTIELAYRDAPGESSAARILALAFRYRSYRGDVVPCLMGGRRGDIALPQVAPALLELARRGCERLRVPDPSALSIVGALSGALHACRADNAPRLALLIERSEERLETFFRMGTLRELARYGTSGAPGMRAKMCVLVGIAISLEREAALRSGMNH